MKKKICFIINPFSGVKEKKALEKLIPKTLDLNLFDFEIAYTHGPNHASILTKDAILRKVDIIAAVGGDGTVNEVGKELIDKDIPLAIIPMGSGNGLARHLGIPLEEKKAISLINQGKEKFIDTVKINDSVYIGVAGVGFDAHISWIFSRMKKRGFFRYVQIVLQEFLRYQPTSFELRIDDIPIKTSAFLISFANSSQYGNNFHIAPKANICDGLIDVTLVKPFPKIRFPEMACRLFFQSIDRFAYAKTFKAKKIEVKGGHLQAHIDGEPVLFSHGMHIEIHPHSLKILTPSCPS